MYRPLEGIRIVEWGIFHAGPGGPAILSDMGAEVIKIEQPGMGDPIRQVSEYKKIDFGFGNGRNMFFEGANRGKKSITINLADKQGREIAYNLVRESDVFFTNLRPSTVKRMEMDYATLSKINPQLIYASVTSFGSQGPYADRGGFDFQGQGKSGLMFSLGEPGMKPLLAQFGLADQSTAVMASYQIIIALLMRERFGIGQEVEVSILSTVSYLMYFNHLTSLLTGFEVPRHEQANADPLRNYYECKDGKWLVLTDHPNSGNWPLVCELLGHPELADDPRFTDRQSRMMDSRELVAVFNEAFLTKPRDEWLKLFSEKNMVICEVNTCLDAVQDPQMLENGYIVDYDHPELGPMKIPGFPIRFSNAEISHNLRAPGVGEHTESVLREIGGYDEEEIARFRRDNIV
ncbi:MAG: CoA transferase [Thermodesulfobacteriota bacterium]|nr:CoA transferase [Thermodesulfobacteriota bacterium]